MCLSTCIHVEKLQCSAKSNPAFRYELSQQSPPSLDLGPSPSPSLLCRLAAQTRTKGTEGKGRSPMKRTRRKQPPAGQPCPPPLVPRKRAGFLFLGKEQGVNRKEKERIEGIRWGETPCRLPDGSRIARPRKIRFPLRIPRIAQRASTEAVRWAWGEALAFFHIRIRNRGLTPPATADLST